jgi:hypothetical protein
MGSGHACFSEKVKVGLFLIKVGMLSLPILKNI